MSGKSDFITLGDGSVVCDEGVVVKGSRLSYRDLSLVIDEEVSLPYNADGEKLCCKCDVVKPLGEFPTDPRSADGHENRCNDCEAERKRLEYAEEVKRREGREVRPYRRESA